MENSNTNTTDKQCFKIFKGKIPVMVSAPHASKHLRNGVKMNNEILTGELAFHLYKKLGCHCIIKNKTSVYDPNYDKSNEYKEELLKYIKENNITFLIDLHGCLENNDFSIDIGTGGVKLKHVIKDILPTYDIIGLPITYNKKFKAIKNDTITKYISRNCQDCICLQFEINRLFRDYENPKNLKLLGKFMCCLVENIIKGQHQKHTVKKNR